MRVTQNTNFNLVQDSIHKSRSRLEDFQVQASSLKKLNRPSDNPVGAKKILELRTDKVNNEQFQTNAKLAEAFLNNTDHVLSELTEVVMRAKEIALNQSSGASATAETRLGVAEEVAQLAKRAMAISNTKIGDRYLFGGFKTQSPPVTGEGRYEGDDGEIMVEIAKDVFLAVNLPGVEAFNTNPQMSVDGQRLWGQAKGEEGEDRTPASASIEFQNRPGLGDENVNVFQELQNLRISLLTNDTEGVRSTLDRFDDIRMHVVSARAKVGSRLSGLRSTLDTMERANITNAELKTKLEDADMVEVMNNIAKEEIVLRGVLQGSRRLVQPTLMDFLK